MSRDEREAVAMWAAPRPRENASVVGDKSPAARPMPAARTDRHALKPGFRLRNVAEKAGEGMLFLVAASIIGVVFLIFAFVFKAALPIVTQRATTAATEETIAPETWRERPRGEVAAFLGFDSAEELAELDDATIDELVAALAAEHTGPSNPDRGVNAVSWENMIVPRQWHGATYDRPAFAWQPVAEVPKYNIVPLFLGSLKATIVAMLFAVPLSFIAAVYVSQFARPAFRTAVKPAIEMLAGIPSVVLGMFGLMILASALQRVFDFDARLNATVAGIALGLAVIPVVFTVMEDVLTAVPNSYRDASLALGATPWQTALRVVVPSALPGLFAAAVLGFGRAIGETMVVLMASGNASVMSWNLADPIRTVTATIAAELPDVHFGDIHYMMLFFLGSLLFLVTFVTNFGGDLVVHRMRRRLEGRA